MTAIIPTTAIGDLFYANTTTTLARLPIGPPGWQLVVDNGVPTWKRTADPLMVQLTEQVEYPDDLNFQISLIEGN